MWNAFRRDGQPTIFKLMSNWRPVILLSGFGPFPGVPENASGLLVPELAAVARKRWPGFHVETALLPTEWAKGPTMVQDLLRELKPALALHFGVSSKARGFAIESRAHNFARPVEDAAGRLPRSERLLPEGPYVLAARIPVLPVIKRLRQRSLPVSLSRDAGGYLCNAVLYTSLVEASRADWPMRSGFVHLPTMLASTPASRRAAVGLDWQQAVEGSLEVISVALGRPEPIDRRERTSKPGVVQRIEPPRSAPNACRR